MRRGATGTTRTRDRRRGLLRRLWRAPDGATAVEMAFVLPILMLVLFGIIEFGRAVWTQSSLQFAVAAAARCAAVSPSKCANVPSYAASQAYGMSIPEGDFTYTSGASCGIAGYSQGAQVSATYTFKTFVAAIIPSLSNVTLSAQSCHP